MPCDYKLCSFNCIYCHYGLTDVLSLDMQNHLKDLPGIEMVLDEVEKVMGSSLEFDYLTFSGNGEPTLHPHFAEIVQGIIDLRDSYRPAVRIALLSNSSGVNLKEVRRVIPKIDLPVFKLDAGKKGKFKQINKPAKGVDFEEIVEFLKEIEGIYIQTVLMSGNPSNVAKDDLRSYFEKIAKIGPVEVQVYSLDRPVPNQNIKRVKPGELKKIAALGSKETGVKIRAFYME